MGDGEIDALNSSYEIHWDDHDKFWISRNIGVGKRTNYVSARHRLNFSIRVEATDFELMEGLHASSGYLIGEDDLINREHPEIEDWYVDGEPVVYIDGKPALDPYKIGTIHTEAVTKQNARLCGKATVATPQNLGVMGNEEETFTKGRVTITQQETAAPVRFGISLPGDFWIEMSLKPDDFRLIVNALEGGDALWIEFRDFSFDPILVTEDGLRSFDCLYWVPYKEPFKQIYDRLSKIRPNGLRRSPEVSLSFARRGLRSPESGMPVEPAKRREDCQSLNKLSPTNKLLEMQLEALGELRSLLRRMSALVLLFLVLVSTSVFLSL